MAEVVKLISPNKVKRNPENPRLIFRSEELEGLEGSIALQGILVPLTVFQEGHEYVLLDGERRWRCALKLALGSVPVIIQPKPDKMQNIMMMFAIHNARKDWDPLPTAFKLQELEKEFTKRNGRGPTESELAGISSLTRGEVRRLKILLQLPKEFLNELLEELEKPGSRQEISVDHVLEATRAASALRKRSIIDADTENKLRRAILIKFRRKVIVNTVAPRKLVKLARAVDRSEVSLLAARRVVIKLIAVSGYSIDDAYTATVEQADFTHGLTQLLERVIQKLEEFDSRDIELTDSLRRTIANLRQRLGKIRGI